MKNQMGIQMGVTITADSFMVGGNWGFVLDSNTDANRILEILQSDERNKIIRVMNGFLVTCNKEALVQSIQQVMPLTQEVLDVHKNRLNMEIIEFQKYLTQILRNGMPTGMLDKDDTVEYTFGIYSCNKMHKMRLNGIEYPAYNLTLSEVTKELLKLRSKMVVYVGVANGYKDLKEITDISQLYSGLELAESQNGALMCICVRK